MNYLFLGLQYDKEKEDYYIRKSKIGLQAAINSFQWGIVDGFIDNGANITILNTVPVGTYPFCYQDGLLSSRKWNYRGCQAIEIGYTNLSLLKQISRRRNYLLQIINWIESVPGPKTIVAYSLYLPFLQLFQRLKLVYSEVHFCMIVPDLPCEYGILPKNKLKAFLMKRYGRKTLQLTGCIDSFVLLTESMKKPLAVKGRPYVTIEGIYAKVHEENQVEKSRKKIILYSGTLNYEFGINILLEAFSLIHSQEYELWICGAGEAAREVQEMSLIDKRIYFYGFLNRQEVMRLQKKAMLLVNPRMNKGEYTKYSFPSKTLEYMASGVPVLMHKLDGIPDEYDDYLYYITDNSTETLAKMIQEICTMSAQELDNHGEKARDYVLHEKNSIKQVAKILNMIEGANK